MAILDPPGWRVYVGMGGGFAIGTGGGFGVGIGGGFAIGTGGGIHRNTHVFAQSLSTVRLDIATRTLWVRLGLSLYKAALSKPRMILSGKLSSTLERVNIIAI